MTALAIAAGVALAVSISVLLSSVDRSLSAFGGALAGPAELRITGATLRGGLPVGAVDAATRVDGVADVVPLVQTVAPSQTSPGSKLEPALVLGIDCRAERLFGPFGCDPAALAAAPGPVAVGPALAGKAEALLRTDQGRLPLAGATMSTRLRPIADGRVVVMPLAVAQEQFTRAEQVDVAYVLLTPGSDPERVRADLQKAVGPQLPVIGATDPPAGASAVLGAALPIYSLLGIFALGIGGVLVANTAAMSLEARRRELAMLGALGGRPSTVVASTAAEMLVLGAAGGLLGTLGGVVVAAPIVASLSSFTEQVAGVSLTVHAGLGSLITGLVLGMALGGGSALIPARRASRLDIASELSGRQGGDQSKPARLSRRLVVWGAITAIGMAGCAAAALDGSLEPWQAAIIAPAFLVVTIGTLFVVAAAVPMLVGGVAGLASEVPDAAVRIALAAARRDHRRTGVLAVTVSAAVVTAFVTAGSSASARTSIEASFRRGGEGVNVTTTPPRDNFGPSVPPTLLAALAALPGVAEVTTGQFVVAGRGKSLTVVSSSTGGRLTNEVIDGVADPARLEAGEVLIGAGLARRQQVRAGDVVALTTPTGSVELPIQGVWEDGNNAGANITMSPALLEQLYGPQPPDFVMLRPQAGISESELARSVADAKLDPELQTRTAGAVANDIADNVDEQFASFRVMQRALLVVLFVAVLSSLLLAGVQRQRELGLLAAVGADRRGLVRALLLEAGVVATLAVALSALVGPIMMWSISQMMPFVIGFRNELTFDWPSLATAGLAAIAVVLAGAAWPAQRVSRVEVLDALRYE